MCEFGQAVVLLLEAIPAQQPRDHLQVAAVTGDVLIKLRLAMQLDTELSWRGAGCQRP
jgi:hypothetical protein